MRTSRLKDGPPTRFNVEDVSRKIEIEVPVGYYRLLEKVATAQGITVPDLVKRELGLAGRGLSFEELDARVRARKPSGGSTAENVRIIREARGD
jgi:hypothetical protein